MMNVSGWRDEPAPSLSPLAARLLRWMSDATPAPQEPSEEVAARLALALLELCEARAIALWTALDGAPQLRLLARAGEFDASDEPGAPNEAEALAVEFEAQDWPTAPFFIVEGEGGARDLAVKLGLLSEQIAAPSLALPLGDAGLALFWLQSEDGRLSEDWAPVFEMAGAQAGAWLLIASRGERLNRAFRQFAEAVADAVDGREPGRDGYSAAVAYYAGLIARQMELDESEAQIIEFAALLGRLGRLSVPEEILQKEEALSGQELERARASTSTGANWLSAVEGLEEVALLVRHQGEYFDGSGSPAGFAGDEIPLGSRILAVAARFAAMTARRADRAPLSVVGGAMDRMAADAGIALDPRVVQAFLRAMGRSVS